MSASLHDRIRALVADLKTFDVLGAEHKAASLAWLDSTTDIFRRSKPGTPSPHLVSYFLLVDRSADRVLLCDHRLARLWLPTGGHVDPGEHPLETVRREVREELGIDAEFDPVFGDAPFFLTVTETARSDLRHTDVSLWFALAGSDKLELRPDEREFVEVRWWTRADLKALDPTTIEPHLFRALDVLASNVS